MGNVAVTLSTPAPTQDIFGNQYVIQGTLHLSTSYATGGDTLTLSQLGINNLFFLEMGPAVNEAATANTWLLSYVPPTTSGGTAVVLIQAWTAAGSPSTSQGLVEAASTTDLHLNIANFIAYGSD